MIPRPPVKLHSIRPVVAVAMLFMLSTLAACGGGGGSSAPETNGVGLLSSWLPDGTRDVFYSASLVATGGSGSGYTWSLVLGDLPAGVSGLPATGTTLRLTGTPTAGGTFDFTVRLRDDAGDTRDLPLRIVVQGEGGGGGGTPGTSRLTSTIGAPSGRTAHTAVWTGTEMIVWGGWNRFGPMNSGGAYNPTTDTWRPVSNVGAPGIRSDHTATWTGTEMVIVGGYNNGTILGDAAAYNPTTDTWRTLPTNGAPPARVGHSAVWSGSRVLVWGGQGRYPPPAPNSVVLVYDNGAGYAPGSNAWFPVPSLGTIAQSHAAAWTGTRMLVWGGQDNFALSVQTLNTGGIYNPSTNQWVATSRTGAPAARTAHTGVWSGSRFLVWGGTPNGLLRLNTGGQLDPTSNTWSPITTIGAPSARLRHTAVWTGTEMVIWGGNTAGGIVSGGGAYRPGSNSWRPLSPNLDPTPRLDHTAVWTGSAMIIWGGIPGSPADVYLNTGAVMVP